VNVNGNRPPLGKISSTNAAVHPARGAATCATQVFGADGVSVFIVHFGPSVSSLKSRLFAFVACQSLTRVGRVAARTVIRSGRSTVQVNCGRVAPVAIDA
jgi:hypothetical protein